MNTQSLSGSMADDAGDALIDVFQLIGGDVSESEPEDSSDSEDAEVCGRSISPANTATLIVSALDSGDNTLQDCSGPPPPKDEIVTDTPMPTAACKTLASVDSAVTSPLEMKKNAESTQETGRVPAVKAASNNSQKRSPGCIKTLYLIGLGLGNEKDVTVRGLEAIRSCDAVFLEAYTSVLGVNAAKLESFYGRPIQIADRDLVETGSDQMLQYGIGTSVALLVVGDPFGATTHTDLFLRARDLGVTVQVVHNASIMNAVGCCGLQLYRFGHCVSLCFFRPKWQPDSFYEHVQRNRKAGLHTLCLLDIKVKEPDYDELVRTGRHRNLPPRYMTTATAVKQLLLVEGKRQQGAYDAKTLCVALARVGQRTQRIVAAPMEQLLHVDMGGPLHSLIIAGKLDAIESKMMACFPPPVVASAASVSGATAE